MKLINNAKEKHTICGLQCTIQQVGDYSVLTFPKNIGLRHKFSVVYKSSGYNCGVKEISLNNRSMEQRGAIGTGWAQRPWGDLGQYLASVGLDSQRFLDIITHHMDLTIVSQFARNTGIVWLSDTKGHSEYSGLYLLTGSYGERSKLFGQVSEWSRNPNSTNDIAIYTGEIRNFIKEADKAAQAG